MTPSTASLAAWNESKPHISDIGRAVGAVIDGVPEQWRGAIKAMQLGRVASDWWGDICDALDKVRNFAKAHGDALRWNIDDYEVCQHARELAAQGAGFDAALIGKGAELAARVDAALLVAKMAGINPPKGIEGEGIIKRIACEHWWRRVLRVQVARVVEGGAIKLGIVNKRGGGYCSNAALKRRSDQQARNAAILSKRFFKNEAGQVWNLGELAALSVANPVIRGGELMARIRGAEEYADARGHIGLFFTGTAPSAFHAVTVGSGGRARPNPKYDGVSLPRDAQAWLCKVWARVRAELARRGIKAYGLRVAEPHHDATPHWHALIWVENEKAFLETQAILWLHWNSEFSDEQGAEIHRCKFERMREGGAAGYVAKYVAKSIGHHALPEHIDEQNGELFEVETGVQGWKRVDAWAATWGIRQFQSFGMPAIGLWRTLRRVTKDQIDEAQLAGDRETVRAWYACHKSEGIAASWCRFVEAVGGMCQQAKRMHLRLAKREKNLSERVNQYGEAVTDQKTVGLRTKRGLFLVSRRFDFAKLNDAEAATASTETGENRAPKASAWTSFNNCTQRLSGELFGLMFGALSQYRGTFPAYRT